MEQAGGAGEDGIIKSSSAAAAGGAVTASRWTTAWPSGQPVTSHHQLIAECPGCIAEQGRSHVCGVDDLTPSSTSMDFHMRAKPHHHVGPSVESSHYRYGELHPSSYAAPSAPRYTYSPVPSSVHHADYQNYCVSPDRARCTCGDRGCVQFSPYDVGGRQSQPHYYGHHVPLPPGTTAVYPGHQIVYSGEHYQIIGPPPPPPLPASHYHHHRHQYPPPSSSAGHYAPAFHEDLASRQIPASAIGRSENADSTCIPIITGATLPAQVNNVDTASDNTRDESKPSASTMLMTGSQHDISPSRDSDASASTSPTTIKSSLLYTHSTVAERVISHSLSSLTASGSADNVATSTASPQPPSHGGSAELVPVKDETPTVTDTAVKTEGRFSERAQHHGSMTFIVDFGGGGGGRDGSTGSGRNPATPLSECLPARLRRKSIQCQNERDDRDKDHDTEIRRKGMSPMQSRKLRGISEGVGQTDRAPGLSRSPAARKRQNVNKTGTAELSSDDDDADQKTDIAKKSQAWSSRSARSFPAHKTPGTEAGGRTTRATDVTSDASSTSKSRGYKKRQMAGTETDIMQRMLFPTAKPPLPSSKFNEQEHLKTVESSLVEERYPADAERMVDQAESDNESAASADTYTIESDDKEEIHQERARIDVAFGIVSESTCNDRPPTEINNDGQLQQPDINQQNQDNDECSLEIREDSDELDQPRLKRAKNQTLFSTAHIEESTLSSNSDRLLDVEDRTNSDDAQQPAVVGRDVSVSLEQETDQTEWKTGEHLHSEVNGVAVHGKSDVTFPRQQAVSDVADASSMLVSATECKEPMSIENSKVSASVEEEDDDDDDDDEDRSQPAAATLLNATKTRNEGNDTNQITSPVKEVDSGLSNTEDVILCIHESGDEFEADDSRDRCFDNRKQIDDDTTNSPSGFDGRRRLPAPPKTDVDSDVTTNARRRQDCAGVKSATNYDGAACEDDNKDLGAFVVAYDAPLTRRDLHPRGSDCSDSEGTTWTAEMRLLAKSKLQIRRQLSNDSRDEEPSAQLNTPSTTKTVNSTKTTSTLSGLNLNGAKMTRNVIVSSDKQLPATTDRFVPILSGATTKTTTTKSSRPSTGPTAIANRTSRARGPPSSGAPNLGGSRSARTTPQGPPASSPTRQVRVRSKSNTGDEYEKPMAAGVRSSRTGVGDVVRRGGVNDEATRRYRTTTDSSAATTRQPVGRATTTRQNAPPPAAPASNRLRSVSQKRPGEVGVVGRTAHDVTRSQYRSPERGRTSTRQSDVVSRMTEQRASMAGMYRSSSASVLPAAPRRATSRSPQRPFAPASATEQEKLQNAREAFKKRMSYDASKSAAMGRAAAARRSGDGSTERLSQSSGDGRRSSHGSVNGICDEDAFGRSAAAVAKYSSSVACDISVMSHRVESGRASNTLNDDDNDSPMTMAYDRILLRSILQMSENVKLYSDRLHNHFRDSPSISVTSDTKSSRNNARAASDCTLKLEEILHNLAYADRRLQACTKICSSTRRLSNRSEP